MVFKVEGAGWARWVKAGCAALTISLSVSLPALSKTLIFCSEGSPENFYPAINLTTTTWDATRLLYDRLVEFERGGTAIVPGLAEKWDIAEDGKSYTFHLRKGVKFHSTKAFKPSRDLNADDVVWSFERQWKDTNPYFKVTSPNHSMFVDMGFSKLLVSIDKLDDYTIRFQLNKPEAPFLADLGMDFAAIQSKEYADQLAKAGTPEKIDQEPIGTGPFYLLQYVKDASIRYRAFADYWQGKAKIDDLIYAITTDASIRWAKVQKGECHTMPFPNPADIEAMHKNPDVTVLDQPGLNIGYLAYNVRRKPFDDVRVRRAFNMAINKKAIIDAVYLSLAVAAINPLPPTIWSYNATIKDDPFDPEAAKKLLAEAGFANGLETDIWAMPVQRAYNPNARRIAELMQADLAKVGVKAEIKSYEWGEYRKRLQTGEQQSGMLGWTGQNGDPDNFLNQLLGCEAATGGGNIAGWCNQKFQDLVTKAKTLTDRTERTKLYEQAQVIFKEEAPWFTIAHAIQVMPVRKEVIDYKLSPFNRHDFYGVDIKG